MKITSFVLALLPLIPDATSYRIRTYSEEGCEGDAKEGNVWDNTCRDKNVMGTRSFEVLAYGANRQRAVFYGDGACFYVPGADRRIWWADAGGGFKKGECIDVGFKAKAFGSQSA